MGGRGGKTLWFSISDLIIRAIKSIELGERGIEFKEGEE